MAIAILFQRGNTILKNGLCFNNKSQIVSEILAYLAENPDAQDTIDGIVQWWLLERKIKYQQSIVKEAVKELVANGFVLEHKKRDLKNHYRLNKNKLEEIQEILKKRLDYKGINSSTI